MRNLIFFLLFAPLVSVAQDTIKVDKTTLAGHHLSESASSFQYAFLSSVASGLLVVLYTVEPQAVFLGLSGVGGIATILFTIHAISQLRKAGEILKNGLSSAQLSVIP